MHAASASGVAGGNQEARAGVLHHLREAADGAGDHGAATLHRLERDHPEALAERGHDHDLGTLEDRGRRRDAAEERHAVVEPEPNDARPQLLLQRPVSRDLQGDVRQVVPRPWRAPAAAPRALDRDQAADDREPRHPGSGGGVGPGSIP